MARYRAYWTRPIQKRPERIETRRRRSLQCGNDLKWDTNSEGDAGAATYKQFAQQAVKEGRAVSGPEDEADGDAGAASKWQSAESEQHNSVITVS